MARILVVEDEVLVGRMMQLNLRAEGHQVCWIKSSEGIEEALGSGDFDIVVMDIMLPGRDGLEATKALRRKGFCMPILMVTARDQVKDKVEGLDSGADDYLTKPFSVEEFLARIRALLKRK